MGVNRWGWRGLIAGIIVVGVFAVSGRALAEAAHAEARQHFERGRELESDGDLVGARREYVRAQELRPSYRLHRHIGRTSEGLGQLVDAVERYRAYLDEGGSQVARRDRAEVTEAITNLERRLAHLRVETLDDAMVLVNGELLGTTPLPDALPIDPGTLHIEVRLDGHQPFEEDRSAVEGEELVIEAPLEPLDDDDWAGERQAGSPPNAQQAGGRRRVHRAAFWSTFGFATAFLVGGAACGGMSLARQNDFDDLNQPDRTDEENASLIDVGEAGRTFQILADAFLLSGATMAVVALVLSFFTDFDGVRTSDAPGSGIGLRFSPLGLSVQWGQR